MAIRQGIHGVPVAFLRCHRIMDQGLSFRARCTVHFGHKATRIQVAETCMRCRIPRQSEAFVRLARFLNVGLRTVRAPQMVFA